MIHTATYCDIAKKVIVAEAKAVSSLTQRINKTFSDICILLMECQSRVIFVGMGKSGHIAKKIAATFASTGSPAFFVHPAEANHGDMGVITPDDVVIAISYSGETREIIQMLPTFKRLGIPLVSLTGCLTSTLAKHATYHLDISVEQEACPLGLAPTSSTTAALVMGDALALTLSEVRGFTPTDFALSHPGGNLGKRLLLRVADIMHTGKAMPMVTDHSTLKTALLEMSSKNLGFTLIVCPQSDQLLGIFTDGDLRRALNQNLEITTTQIHTIMTTDCSL